LIETERAKISSKSSTKVTFESFCAWKKKKLRERYLKLKEDERKKLKTFKSGKQSGLSGRDLFSYNPELMVDNYGEEDGDVIQYDREDGDDAENENETKAFEITDKTFGFVDADGKLVDFDEDELGAEEINGATNASHIVFNENLFEDDAGIIDSDEDSESDETDELSERVKQMTND